MSERIKWKESVGREFEQLNTGLGGADEAGGGPASLSQSLSEYLGGLKTYKRADLSLKFGARSPGDRTAINLDRKGAGATFAVGTRPAAALPEAGGTAERMSVRSTVRPPSLSADRLMNEDDENWTADVSLTGPAGSLADAYPLGTRIVGFRRYAEAHGHALVSGPDDFIPLHWHREHTMRDALPLYVANKVPVSALQEAIDLGCKVEVHGTYPNEFPNIASVLGFKDVQRIPFRIHPEQKRHNYVRPQYFWARKLGKPVLVAAVTPGKDYVYHYAEMIRYELASRGADTQRALSVTRYPAVERNIAHWTGLNEKLIKKGDRVIFGNFDAFEKKMTGALGAAHLATEENDFYSSSRYRLKDGSTINFLGVKYSYWGNTSVPLIRQASRLGATEIIYAAKLGTLTSPDDVYKRIFMPSEYIVTRHDKVLGRTQGSPNRVLAANPGMDSGVHSSVPTVLEESSYQHRLLRAENTNTIDNEISQMAAEIMRQNKNKRYTPITFSAVHFATDFLHGTADGENISMNLATNRTPETRAAKADILEKISDTLIEYFVVPQSKSPEPSRTFQVIKVRRNPPEPQAQP